MERLTNHGKVAPALSVISPYRANDILNVNTAVWSSRKQNHVVASTAVAVTIRARPLARAQPTLIRSRIASSFELSKPQIAYATVAPR